MLLLLVYSTAYSQTSGPLIIRGKVLDKKDRLPVIGASVVELNKEKRTVTGVNTDMEGNFAIKVSNIENQLSVSFIGYQTYLTGPINTRRSITILLDGSSKELAEVAVTARKTVNTGSGLNIDARSSTLASTTINAKDLEELPVASIDQALQGRMPGVDFATTSGDPGAGMSIRIRGTSSISGNANPLIVMDGMPYQTEIPEDFNFGTADELGYAQLLNIAPTDIKDITVLKDAAATAVWGAQAANGVLIINTKRGNIGKPMVSYNFKGTMSVQPRMIPMLNGDQYSMLIPEEIMNATGLPLDFLGNSGQNKAFQYDPFDSYYYYNYSNNTNWINLITRNGYSAENNISISGGGEKARYYASVGYLSQTGTSIGTDLGRITTKINLDYTVSSRLRFRTDLTYTHIDNSLNYNASLRSVAFNKMPNMAPYEYDEYGNLKDTYFSPASNIQGYATVSSNGTLSGTFNPLAAAREGFSKLYGERITPRFNLTYDIIPNTLVTSADVLFDINNSKAKTFLPQIATGRPGNEVIVNRASDSDGDSYGISTKFNLVYTPNLGEKHMFQSLLSVQTNDNRNNGYSAVTANTASSNLTDPSNPSVTGSTGLSLQSTQSQSRNAAALIQAQYGYLDRYIIAVNARVDGNSKFASKNRYGLFPGLSARWRISGEPFMRSLKFLNEFSLRLSYGASGNAPGSNYAYFNAFSPYDWGYAGRAAIYSSNIGLSNLKWETVVGKNLGFNVGMFNDRIRIDAEIYQNTTKDMFYKNLRIPTSSGFTNVSMNVGTMDNNGWEFNLNTIPYKSKDLTIGFDFNIARNANTIRTISEFYPRESITGIPVQGDYKSYLIPGNPFGSYYGFKYKGVYKDKDATIAKNEQGSNIIGPNGQVVYMRYNYPNVDYIFQPGDAMYEDINHDGNIDQMDMVYLGNGIPKFTGGFGPRITIKNTLTLQAFFSYRWKYDIVNKAAMTTSNMYGVNNQSTAVLRRWRNPGDITDMPRALYNDGYNWLGSDRYVEDASFLRLSSVTVRYNLNKALLSKLGLKTGSAYFTGQNLFTLTNYTGQNPDVSIIGSTDPFKYPQDTALTPPSITFTLGITAGF